MSTFPGAWVLFPEYGCFSRTIAGILNILFFSTHSEDAGVSTVITLQEDNNNITFYIRSEKTWYHDKTVCPHEVNTPGNQGEDVNDTSVTGLSSLKARVVNAVAWCFVVGVKTALRGTLHLYHYAYWCCMTKLLLMISLNYSYIWCFQVPTCQLRCELAVSVTPCQAFRIIRVTRILKTAQLVRIFRFVMALRTVL